MQNLLRTSSKVYSASKWNEILTDTILENDELFEVRVFQVGVGWSWMLVSSRSEVIKKKFKSEELGIEEEIEKSFTSRNWEAEL